MELKLVNNRKVLLLCAVAVWFGIFSISCRSSKKGGGNKVVSKEVSISVKEIHGNESQKKIVEEAISWVGTPYAYAKCDKKDGTDCSGMVLRVYEDVMGWKLPRNSAKQAEFCIPLDKDDVETGDLVFFATGRDPDKISHVGIMIDKVNFVHASTKKGVIVSRIDTPYYIRTFKMFGRVPQAAENRD